MLFQNNEQLSLNVCDSESFGFCVTTLLGSGARTAHQVYQLATSKMVQGSNTSGGRDFPHLSRPALGPI